MGDDGFRRGVRLVVRAKGTDNQESCQKSFTKQAISPPVTLPPLISVKSFVFGTIYQRAMHALVEVRLSAVALLREPERERDWIMIRGIDGRVDLSKCCLERSRYKCPIN